jgi:hypothetical protein
MPRGREVVEAGDLTGATAGPAYPGPPVVVVIPPEEDDDD